MLRSSVIGVVTAVTLFSQAAVATADPAVPAAGTPCGSGLDGAMTMPQDRGAPLVCTGSEWQPVTTPYPISDRWFTHGAAIQLRGQGRANPTMLSGQWTATPQDPESSCHAAQVAVIPGSPTVGAPRMDDGQPGQPLSLEVAPTMSSMQISGDCIWQRTEADPAPPSW